MEPKRSKAERDARPSGMVVGPIPRGIEVLVKKAAVDPAFKQVLLEKRAKAADEIGLKLGPAEVMLLNAVPAAQLETIIANTNVSEVTRAAFLGRAAAVMLAALGVSTAGCSGGEVKGVRPDRIPVTDGIRPGQPPKKESAEPEPPPQAQPKPLERPTEVWPTDGISPDRP